MRALRDILSSIIKKVEKYEELTSTLNSLPFRYLLAISNCHNLQTVLLYILSSMYNMIEIDEEYKNILNIIPFRYLLKISDRHNLQKIFLHILFSIFIRLKRYDIL